MNAPPDFPPHFHWNPLQVAFMRAGMAAVVLWLGLHLGLQPYEMDPQKAHGLAKVVPLMWMLDPSVLVVSRCLAVAGLLAFAFGWCPLLSLVPPLVYGTIMGSLRLSLGDVSHSTQLPYMVLVAAWLTYGWAAVRSKTLRPVAATHRLAAFAALVMLAASYVASGIVKVKESKGRWVQNTPNLAVQMVKSNLSDHYSKPSGPVDSVFSEKTPRFFAEHPKLTMVLFGSGLFLELGALCLVLGPRWSLWGGLALLGMHIGISAFMAIEFWSHMALLAVLCVLPNLPCGYSVIHSRGKRAKTSPLSEPLS